MITANKCRQLDATVDSSSMEELVHELCSGLTSAVNKCTQSDDGIQILINRSNLENIFNNLLNLYMNLQKKIILHIY